MSNDLSASKEPAIDRSDSSRSVPPPTYRAGKHRVRTAILAFAVAGLAAVAMAAAPTTPAGAATQTLWGAPGAIYEGAHYIHCNNGASPSIWVEGVQTWASPVGGYQRVGADVILFKWTNAGWTEVGRQALGFNFTRVGYGSVSFGSAAWNLSSHGYYKADIRVQWVNQYGGLIGQNIIQPAVPGDFSAWYAYNGYCWA
jgi:hypothetical protein